MSDSQEPQAEPLTLEETARATADLAKREDAGRVAAAFLELVQRWASPSAVLAAVRDPAGVAGFRLVPALSTGSIALGVERTLARLVEDTPECLARPTVVRGEELPGIRVRDNVVVPWWSETDSGLLVLRGVPRPSRPGLGEALALAAAVVWPRLLGGPAGKVETLVQELQSAAARLDSEAARQLERLKAAAPAPAAVTASADAARIAELEDSLEAARREIEAARHDFETARRERETAGLDLAAARQQSENARRELAEAIEERRTAERDLDVTRRELASRMATPTSAPETPTSEMPAVKLPAPGDRQGDRASEALKLAIASVRRAAFVPAMLRVSIEEVAALASLEPTPARKHGVALLDRDVVALEPVAGELEQTGVDVRLAHQPEELALLLRMNASGIDAVVCDVMSFRPDQNVAGLLRAWDKDRPGLAFFLSYDAQSPVELERARRTPMSLTAGHIQRPLTAARLTETLENLAAKRPPKAP